MKAIRAATVNTLTDEYAPDTGMAISILHGKGFPNVDTAPQTMLNADQWILID